MKAYCYASGLIEFGNKVPKGALAIAIGPDAMLRDFISGVARHGYKSAEINGRMTKVPGTDCLLVPGVPEAQNQTAAMDKLIEWRAWIKKSAPRSLTI